MSAFGLSLKDIMSHAITSSLLQSGPIFLKKIAHGERPKISHSYIYNTRIMI